MCHRPLLECLLALMHKTAAYEPTNRNFLATRLHRSKPIFGRDFKGFSSLIFVSDILVDFCNVSMFYLSLNLQVHRLMLPATYLSTALVL